MIKDFNTFLKESKYDRGQLNDYLSNLGLDLQDYNGFLDHFKSKFKIPAKNIKSIKSAIKDLENYEAEDKSKEDIYDVDYRTVELIDDIYLEFEELIHNGIINLDI